MTIWNLGSINADHVYLLPHLPAPGETLAARALSTGLGGKGANMSVACARGGATVRHLGAVGPDGAWAVERLAAYGVDTAHIAALDVPTGHAIIAVDPRGENTILLFPGANRALPAPHVEAALARAAPGDWLLAQNETNLQVEAAEIAKSRGLRVAYACAPFDADAVAALLPCADLLLLNEVEAAQLQDRTGRAPQDLGVPDVVVTLGARGARWHHGPTATEVPALRVTPVDTTGAGDAFTGFLLAGLDRGEPMAEALRLAARAAALKVTRRGAADAIPTRAEAQAFEGEDA